MLTPGREIGTWPAGEYQGSRQKLLKTFGEGAEGGCLAYIYPGGTGGEVENMSPVMQLL